MVDIQTDTQMQATTIPKGQNWPQVKSIKTTSVETVSTGVLEKIKDII